MIAHPKTLALALVCSFGLATTAPLAAQDKEEREPDPKVAEKIEQLEECLTDRKGEKDAEAVKIIRELVEGFPKMVGEDQEDVFKIVSKVFRARRKPDQPQLYREAITALGTMGEQADPDDKWGRKLRQSAADVLMNVADSRPLTEDGWEATQELAYENVGRTHDDRKQVVNNFLVEKAIKAPYEHVMRAAGKALNHYGDLEGKERKEIFDKLLKRYMEIEGRSRASVAPGDNDMATARRILQAIQDPWNQTLATMSGANHRTAEDWVKWWNENKNDRKVWK